MVGQFVPAYSNGNAQFVPAFSRVGNTISINSILQSQTLQTSTLAQAHGLLSIANMTQGQIVDAVALEQLHSLAVSNINQSQMVSSLALEQLIQLDIDSIDQGQTADNASFFQTIVLNIDSISQTQVIGTLSVSQISDLIIDNIKQGQMVSGVRFTNTKGKVTVIIDIKQPGVQFDARIPGVNITVK